MKLGSAWNLPGRWRIRRRDAVARACPVAWGVPRFTADEYGRKTVTFGFWFIGYVVLAYWVCFCEDCIDMRHQQNMIDQDASLYERLMTKYDEEFVREVFDRRIHLRELQGEQTRRV